MVRRSSSSSRKIANIYNVLRRGLRWDSLLFLVLGTRLERLDIHACSEPNAVEMFERLNTWLYLNRIHIEMSENDPAQRESTRDGRRGAARAEGGRAPEAAVLLFGGVPEGGTRAARAPAGRAPRSRSLSAGSPPVRTPHPLRFTAPELSASCAREGFPPAPRRGSV